MGRGTCSPAFLSSRSLRVSKTVEVVFPVPRFPRSAHRLECSPSNPRAHEARRSTACGVSAALLTFEGASSLRSSSNTPTTARAGTTSVSGARFPRFDRASAISSDRSSRVRGVCSESVGSARVMTSKTRFANSCSASCPAACALSKEPPETMSRRFNGSTDALGTMFSSVTMIGRRGAALTR